MVSLFTFENVHRAYLDCRRGKRNSRSALEFEARLEENLFGLCDELQNRTYRPQPSICFVTERPKHREIFAGEFRDRVVHHLIVSRLEPMWEPAFIHDSYACRKGKGTHAAVYKLQQFFREATANGSRPAWCLHCDVRSYFLKIDKAILLDRLRHRLRKRAPEWRSEMDWLLERVVMRDTASDAVRKGQLDLFDLVPPHKSLFHTENKTGLPIGNYTSQFFANVYLDALDQFAKHTLKIRHYVRYVDDVVMVAEDHGDLERWEAAMKEFLSANLRLEWNPQSRRLAPVSNGCDFLGYIVFRNGLRVRRRTVAHCSEKLAAARRVLVRPARGGVACFQYDEETVAALQATVASYDGQFRHACAAAVWRRLFSRFPYLRFYLRRDGHRWRRLDAAPKRFSNLPEQYGWFARKFRRCLLMFRIGAFYEFFQEQRERAARTLDLREGRGRRGIGPGVGLHYRSKALRNPKWLSAAIPVAFVEPTTGVAGNVPQRKLTRLYVKLPCG